METAAHMPSGWMALIWGVITFSLLVVVHEGGHFLLARLFGIKVHEFMIGLPGPALRVRSKKSGVAYGVSAFPLGGYVRIAGMEPGDEDPLLARALSDIATRGTADPGDLAVRLGIPSDHALALLTTLADYGAIEQRPASDTFAFVGDKPAADQDPAETLSRARAITYRGHPIWQRIAILAAGVVFNILAAFLIFTITLSVWGYEVPSLKIASVVKGSPALAAGMRAGDRIVSFDGKSAGDWPELLALIGRKRPGDAATVTVSRGDVRRTFRVKLAGRDGHAFLGVGSGVETKRFTVPQAMGESLKWTGMVFVAIGQFFNPRTFSESVQGARSVVGISYEVARAAEAGPIQYAWMVAFLSLSLGAVNLVPIPPLDGGKVLLEVVEKIRRRPLRRELSYALSALGAVVLFSLIFYLMYADVVRYIVKG